MDSGSILNAINSSFILCLSTINFIYTHKTLEYVGTDFVGTLNETPSGNRYILTCTDLFSKWPVAYPLPNKEAITVAKAILQLVTTYGFPYAIISDNGTEFCNQVNNLYFGHFVFVARPLI